MHGILNDATLSREDAIAAEVDRVHARRPASADYEDESAVWHSGAFHPTLPPVPAGFPAEVPDGFALPRAEAAWLRDRMLASAPDTMLEYALHHRPDTNSAVPWEDSVLMSADGERRGVLDDARRFSILMNGASLPTADSAQPSSPYSGPRPTNPKPHSDWTTKRVPLNSDTAANLDRSLPVGATAST